MLFRGRYWNLKWDKRATPPTKHTTHSNANIGILWLVFTDSCQLRAPLSPNYEELSIKLHKRNKGFGLKVRKDHDWS